MHAAIVYVYRYLALTIRRPRAVVSFSLAGRMDQVLIGINACLYTSFPGGVEKAIEGAVAGLLTQPGLSSILFLISESLLARFPAIPEGQSINIRNIKYRCRVQRILYEQLAVLRYKIPLWHHLGYVMPYFGFRSRHVVSIYDIIALTHPTLCTKLNRCYYGLALPHTIRSADRITVPSEHVRRVISERFAEAEERIRVLPLPLPICVANEVLNSGCKKPDAVLPEKGFLLFVGNAGPKKNLDFALRVYARLPESIRERFGAEPIGQKPFLTIAQDF